MRHIVAVLAVCFVASSALSTRTLASPTTYLLEATLIDGWRMDSGPSFLYPEGDYRLAGGYITTDGTIGELGVDNILDYRVEIGGPVPYVLSANPAHELNMDRFFASATNLYAQPSDGELNAGYFLIAEDNPTTLCADCVRYANWFGPKQDKPTKFLYEVEDEEHWVIPNLSMVGPVSQVATVAVPEPSGYAVWLMLAALAVAKQKRLQIMPSGHRPNRG